MDYILGKDKIIIYNCEDFNIMHILECGQIFTYKKVADFEYEVYSKDKIARVVFDGKKYVILTSDVEYFVNFFDLSTDYREIKRKLSEFDKMQDAIKFGYGIRILKQDLLEVIIGFVISANNHIERIKKSMAKIRECGENMGSYYAFPTLVRLGQITETQFREFGCGYRAGYLVKLIKQLEHVDLEETKNWDKNKLKSWLLSLYGVGEKVCDCILLFGYNICQSFPVDTWIEKVYVDLFHVTKPRDKMSKDLIEYFGDLSGYAQQYLFFYKRSKID